jgi:flagellar L-ring protein precursor FlgH
MLNNIGKTLMIAFLGFFLVLSPMTSAFAASLWSDETQNTSLFRDRKAQAVGDILTIIINESSNASRTGSASNSKSASADAAAGVGVFKFIGDASVSSSDSFKAQGSLNNTNKVTGRITVQVIEVKPNGNLLVSGTQTIKQNGEEQRITVTGSVRPDDVTPDNTVLSSNVAEAQIKIDGKGPINSKQKQGILTQIFNFLF